MTKTIFIKPGELKPQWYIVDAKGKIIGRLASRIANFLRGKTKLNFSPNYDFKDHLIVINTKHIAITGKKLEQKFFAKHTGYPSGLKIKTYKQLLQKKPEKLFKKVLSGMMPKNVLAKRILKRVKLYPEEKHQHEAQNPISLEL